MKMKTSLTVERKPAKCEYNNNSEHHVSNPQFNPLVANLQIFLYCKRQTTDLLLVASL